MTWFYWISVSIVMTAAADLLQRIIMRDSKYDAHQTALIFQVLTTLMTGVYALLSGFSFPDLSSIGWNIVLSGICWGFGSFAMFKAYELLGASENAILSSFGTIVTMTASVVFIGERLSARIIVGTMLILGSIAILNLKKGSFHASSGMMYGLITATLYGIAVTSDTYILRAYDAVSYTPVAFFLGFIVLLLSKPTSLKSFVRLSDTTYAVRMVILSLLYAAQAVAYYIALEIGQNSVQIAPIFKSTTILTVLGAVILLRERDHLLLKAASTVLVMAGVLLVK